MDRTVYNDSLQVQMTEQPTWRWCYKCKVPILEAYSVSLRSLHTKKATHLMVVSRTGTSTISSPIFREPPGHVTDTYVSQVSSIDTPELKLKES